MTDDLILSFTFECDKPIKDKATKYFEKLGKEKGYSMNLDSAYTFGRYSKSDMKFTYTKNNKSYQYEIEIKERTTSLSTYPSVMFEEDKLKYLQQQNKKGIRTYFLNVFSDDTALLYDISTLTDEDIEHKLSHQTKHTKLAFNEIKEDIPKIFLPINKGKLINLNA